MWDSYIKALQRELNRKVLTSGNSDYLYVLLYIFINEIYYFKNDLGLVNKVEGLEGFIRALLRREDAIDKSASDAFYKYQQYGRYKLLTQREKVDNQAIIEKEVENKLSYYEDKNQELTEKISFMENNIRAIKGDVSFYSVLRGFNRQALSLRVRYFISLLLLGLVPVFIVYFIGSQWNELVEVTVRSDSENILSVWDEVRLRDVKVFIFSSTLIFLSIYFFRVFLKSFNEISEKLDEVERKAAVTAFFIGYLEIVKESNGDVKESLKRYEEFIFKIGDIKNESIPSPSDSISEFVGYTERVIKAFN